ncbi:MAG: hypothetical protein C4288_14915 [Leptolyngbya sp. ERB_1_1]
MLQKGQIRLETTDHDARVLTIAAIDQARIEDQELTETLWHFTATADFEAAGDCGSHCYSHCQGHG